MDMLEFMPILILEGFAFSLLVVSGAAIAVAVAKAIFKFLGRS